MCSGKAVAVPVRVYIGRQIDARMTDFCLSKSLCVMSPCCSKSLSTCRACVRVSESV